MSRIIIDLDAEKAVLGIGTTQVITELAAKRAVLAVLEVQFVRGIVVQELDAAATGKFELKNVGRYDNTDALTGAAAWTKVGSGTNTFYRFSFALINDALDAKFGVNVPAVVTATAATNLLAATAHGLVVNDIVQFSTTGTLPSPFEPGTDYHVIANGLTADVYKVSLAEGGTEVDITDTGTGTHKFVKVSNDVEEITLMCEVSWQEFGLDHKTQTMDFVVENDVNRDGDTIPVSPAIVYIRGAIRIEATDPDDLIGVDGDIWINSVTQDLFERISGTYVLQFNLQGGPGDPGGLAYLWNTNTASSDPGAGKLKVNNATPGSATLLFISETDNDANGIAAYLATFDDGSSTVKGQLVIRDPASPANLLILDITGTLTDNGAWDTFSITPKLSLGTLTNNLPVRLFFAPKGDAGVKGNAGFEYQFSTSTSGNPGLGKFLFNSGTFLSATAFNISEATATALSPASFHLAAFLALQGAGGSVRKCLVVAMKSDQSACMAFYITSVVTDAGAYDTFIIEPIFTSGTVANNDTFYLQFHRVGDKGDAGDPASYAAPTVIPAGPTADIDWETVVTAEVRVLTADTVFTHINLVPGKTVLLAVQQDSTPRAVTWVGVDVWLGTGGVAPTQSVGSGTIDGYAFWYEGTTLFGMWAAGE